MHRLYWVKDLVEGIEKVGMDQNLSQDSSYSNPLFIQLPFPIRSLNFFEGAPTG